MQIWNRFQLVGELELKFKSLNNTGDPTYTYIKGDIEVHLRHAGLQYWFTIIDDEGMPLSSITFENYTDKEKFMDNFERFCKFFNIET